MVGCIIVAMTVLLGSVLSHDSEEYDTCMGKCRAVVGEDFDYLCPGKCTWIVRDLCLERNDRGSSVRKNCFTTGKERCTDQCEGAPLCLELCNLLYTREVKN
ncbi:hypothetical protein CSKR_112028 [Clonorchis sinensis]|uniref:Uncharacterized protein n=1 Tax=Clonorchis sinensis TaxID=79923 RepID=A0A8T1LZA3_CLOSI|nr:hypothetical protein CSKR_112028 [Clonorchis sinensis]